MHQRIRTSKVSIKVIRMSKNKKRSEQQQLPMAYYLWIPRPVGG